MHAPHHQLVNPACPTRKKKLRKSTPSTQLHYLPPAFRLTFSVTFPVTPETTYLLEFIRKQGVTSPRFTATRVHAASPPQATTLFTPVSRYSPISKGNGRLQQTTDDIENTRVSSTSSFRGFGVSRADTRRRQTDQHRYATSPSQCHTDQESRFLINLHESPSVCRPCRGL